MVTEEKTLELQRATQTFSQFITPVRARIGNAPSAEVLEQHVCFAAAVWNGVVLYQALDDLGPLADVMARIETMPVIERAEWSALLIELFTHKLETARDDLWLYRHAFVYRDKNDALRVSAEALDIVTFFLEGHPLRMGLPN